MNRAIHHLGRWVTLGLAVVGCRGPTPTSSGTTRADLPAATVSARAAEAGDNRSSSKANSSSSSTQHLRFELLTLGGAASDETLPWIVAFHGLGDTPSGFAHLFRGLPFRAHVYLVQAPLAHGSGYDWFGERVTGDPERLALAIQQRVENIAVLLEELSRVPRNRDAAVVTGFSQGGILSFAVAVAGSNHVRAALPLAGWLPPSLAASPPILPVYAFHGEDDRVVPYAATSRMVQSWQSAPSLIEYRTFPGVAHQVSSAMYREWSTRLGELMR